MLPTISDEKELGCTKRGRYTEEVGNMPKEESLPTRKKMRKGTHSCFECTSLTSRIATLRSTLIS